TEAPNSLSRSSSQASARPVRPPRVSNRNSRLDRKCFTNLSQVQKLVEIEQHVGEVHQLLLGKELHAGSTLFGRWRTAESDLIRQLQLARFIVRRRFGHTIREELSLL